MKKKNADLLQGTLDLLLLQVLRQEKRHGYDIAKRILVISEEVLKIGQGSLYPALHRLERKGWIAAKWEKAKDRNRELKFYRLTESGRKQLAHEESRWEELTRAIGLLMAKPREV